MPKLIHAADLHIDSPLRGLDAYEGAPAVEEIRGATRKSLERLVQLALDEKADLLLIAGDVYDTNPLAGTALFFRAQMKRLSDAGIPVVIVRGNHDHAGIAPRNLDLPSGVTVLRDDKAESVEVPRAKAIVHGQSYPRSDCFMDLAESYPAPVPGLFNIGLLHTALGSTLSEHANYAPTSPAALAAHGYQYWALGHVHQAARHDFGGVPIAFPGNLQGRNIRETGAKGALVVEYEGNRVLSIEHRALDAMRWHLVKVDAREAGAGLDLRKLVKQRIFEQTATDRGAGLLCAVRVEVAGTLPAGAEAVGSAALREWLHGELQDAGGLLWLEKTRVDAVPASAALAVVQQQLAALASELYANPEARTALSRELAEVRALLSKADSKLVEAADGSEDGRSLFDEKNALDRALELLRAELR